MRIKISGLNSELEKGCAGFYLIFGGEPLLIEEACTKLRVSSRKNGAQEILRFTAGVDLDWEHIREITRSLSLFGARRQIEIRLPTGKAGIAGNEILSTLIEEDREDLIVVIIAGRIDKRTQSAKWIKLIEQKGVVVEAMAVNPNLLPGWIQDRLRERDILIESGVSERLAFYVEGNLLAAAQEIDKIAVLLPDGNKLTSEWLDNNICDQAKFTIYQFVDSCLQGATTRAMRMLSGLRRDGNDANMLVWALAREFRQLSQMAREIDQGKSRQSVLRNHQVWSSRISCVGTALARHDKHYWNISLARLSELDQAIKGRRVLVGSSWEQLENIVLSLCGINIDYEDSAEMVR
ncbi:MAG: DNA polymerase III subunit delta [Acidiferrobacteraceae bacterium]|nr:DNA polymerase III subunit delta [Acidiferrobacteraceae bacterium]